MVRESKVGDRGAQTRGGDGFDYKAVAELFLSRCKATKRRPRYKRFDTAAEGVRFVVEELPAAVMQGAYLLVEEGRFRMDAIRDLYDSAGYPLRRASEKC